MGGEVSDGGAAGDHREEARLVGGALCRSRRRRGGGRHVPAALQRAVAALDGGERGVHVHLVLPAVVAAERRVPLVHEDVAVEGDVPLAEEAGVEVVVIAVAATAAGGGAGGGGGGGGDQPRQRVMREQPRW